MCVNIAMSLVQRPHRSYAVEQNDFLKQALEHWKQQRQKRIEEMLAEIAALDTTIRQHQIQLGEKLEDLPSPFAMIQGPKGTEIKTSAGHTVVGDYKPRADEFFGKGQAEAAFAYLEKIGYAMSLDAILQAITSGGCRVGGADPKRTLLVTLSQSKRDFVSTGGGNWGLRKFYPNMPKLGRPEGTTPNKKAAVKRGPKKTGKRDANAKTSAVKPKAQKPVEVTPSVADEQSSVVQ
jgi:hypothetical protein